MLTGVETTLFSVVLQTILDTLIVNIRNSITCRRECEKLESAIGKHRPQLERLAQELDDRKRSGQVLAALDEWCADMKAKLVKANETVHECHSGSRLYNAVCSGKLATRIQEIRMQIEDKLAHTTVLETILATSNTPPAANTLQCCHCLRQTTFPGASPQHGASMPHLHTVHSDPLSHHSASGTSHLRHSRSEEVFSTADHDSGYNHPVLDYNQWRNDVNDKLEAEQRTRTEPHRRHSTTGIPHYPRSGASGYPVADTRRYSEPETSTHAPSAPPLPISTPSSPREPFGKMSSYLADGPLLRALHKGHMG